MPDWVQVYRPENPSLITYMEREAYRQYWAHIGWLSPDDPGGLGTRLTPGTELDSVMIESDISRAATAYGEFSNTLRITLPALSQPVVLTLRTQLTVTGAADGEWTVGFSPVSGVGSVLNIRGARRATPPVLATAGLGQPFDIEIRLPSPVTGGDWTITNQRDSGSGTGLNFKNNGLLNGYFAAYAA